MLRRFAFGIILLSCLRAAAEEPRRVALIASPGVDVRPAMDALRDALEAFEIGVLGGSDHRGLAEIDSKRMALCRDINCMAAMWGTHGVPFTGRVAFTGTGEDRRVQLTIVDAKGAVVYEGEQPAAGSQALATAADALAREVNDLFAELAAGPARSGRAGAGGKKKTDTSSADSWTRQEQQDLERPTTPRRFGILAGAELGFGPVLADPARIRGGAQNSFDFTGYGPAFTTSIDGKVQPALNLHGGWNFLDYFAFEAALHTSFWGPGSKDMGGALLVGIRAVAFPVHAILARSKMDVSVEIGGGYAFIGSSGYDMDGGYFSAGLGGEYRLTSLIGLNAYYRMLAAFLPRFYVDYAKGVSEPVHDFAAIWHTFGVGATLHFPVSL